MADDTHCCQDPVGISTRCDGFVGRGDAVGEHRFTVVIRGCGDFAGLDAREILLELSIPGFLWRVRFLPLPLQRLPLRRVIGRLLRLRLRSLLMVHILLLLPLRVGLLPLRKRLTAVEHLGWFLAELLLVVLLRELLRRLPMLLWLLRLLAGELTWLAKVLRLTTELLWLATELWLWLLAKLRLWLATEVRLGLTTELVLWSLAVMLGPELLLFLSPVLDRLRGHWLGRDWSLLVHILLIRHRLRWFMVGWIVWAVLLGLRPRFLLLALVFLPALVVFLAFDGWWLFTVT